MSRQQSRDHALDRHYKNIIGGVEWGDQTTAHHRKRKESMAKLMKKQFARIGFCISFTQIIFIEFYSILHISMLFIIYNQAS